MRLLTLAALCSASAAQAASPARVDALQGEVWVLRGANPVALGAGDALQPGDRVVTGANGRLRLELGPHTSLLLDADAELALPAASQPEEEAAEKWPALNLQRGKACIRYRPIDDDGRQLRLDIGQMLFAAMRHDGHFCATRDPSESAVSLRAGSLQLSHAVDPSLVVISEAGTEIRIFDDGEFALLLPGGDEPLTQYDETPIEAPLETIASPASVPGAAAETQTEAISTAATAATPGAYRYTVYLFSTRSETVAARVNRELQNAGLDTRIIAGNEDTVTRYRVVLSGFDDRAAAEAFAESIRGRHGIESTWIGRQKLPTE